MKRFTAIFALIILALSLIATPALAAPGNGNGAMKVDLGTGFPLGGGLNSFPATPPIVGSVIVNTTANGVLNVLVNPDGLPGGTYEVRVWINYGQSAIGGTYYDGELVINDQGQGNVELHVPIPSDVVPQTGNTIIVCVNLPGTPLYSTGNFLLYLK